MISGIHAIVFSAAPDEVRAFLRDVLGFPSVDAGAGWPIFGLPPAELAVHPGDATRHELFLMCDDLDATIAALTAKGVATGAIVERDWGRLSSIALPDGSELGLYEPRHPRP